MAVDILVFGGRNHPNVSRQPRWSLFDAAVLLRIRGSKVVDRLEYHGSESDRRLGLAACFKAGCVVGNSAYACTNTEILKIDLDRFEIVQSWSNRLFNDLHHVAAIGDRFWVAATGIDSILELDRDFALVRRHPIGTDEVLTRFGPDSDYREIVDTKPHEMHPNFVARWGGGTWVSNVLDEGGARAVREIGSSRTIPISDVFIHDGVPAFGQVWFTAVKGHVVKLDEASGEASAFDLTIRGKGRSPLGWCRGIAPVDRDRAFVGFTKLRSTLQRENVSWVKVRAAAIKNSLTLPTLISLYDFRERRELWKMPLSGHGIDAIFSIHLSGNGMPE